MIDGFISSLKNLFLELELDEEMIMTSVKVGNAIAKTWETEFMKFSIGYKRIYCVHSSETKQTEAKEILQELKDLIEDTL